MRQYLPFILFYQSQQVWRQVIIFHILFIIEFTGVNNPFEMDPLAIGRVILMFIVWIPASEWKKAQYGKAIDRRNKNDKMGHEWRLIGKKCIVLFISFHKKMPIQKQKP